MLNIFLRELRANRRMLLVWALILGGLNVLLLGVYPSFAEDAAKLEELLAMYPEGFIKVFGLDRLSMADAIGFYATEAYFMVVLFGGIFAALLGSGLLAKEEDEKTIEFLLARPVTRSEILTGKVLAFAVYLALFNLIIGLITYASFEIFVTAEYSRYVLVLLLAAPLLAHLTFASLGFLSSLFWARRRAAYSVSIGLVLGTYFLSVLAVLSERFEFLRWLTPFHYVNAADIVLNEAMGGLNILVLVLFNAAVLGVTYYLYNRRDITV